MIPSSMDGKTTPVQGWHCHTVERVSNEYLVNMAMQNLW